MRTIETVLAGGADQLMAERQNTDWGAAKEAAVLAALRLIRTAFAFDTAVVAALRHTEQSGEAQALVEGHLWLMGENTVVSGTGGTITNHTHL